ncbi:hypothetical protein CANARDRAFT_188781, partial [[Candida] arabinofermentans NRRL YB-2248]
IIPSPIVSSTHCYIWTIQFDDTTIPLTYLKDTSLNGCFVEGVRIGKGKYKLLEHGDTIEIRDALKLQYNLQDCYVDSLEVDLEDLEDQDDGDWRVLPRCIGVGTFGRVSEYQNKVVLKSHKLYAVKLMNLDTTVKNRLRLESSILSKLAHPNIIKILREVIRSCSQVRIYQNLAIGGDLFSYLSQDQKILQPISESESLLMSFQILQALSYLHLKGVVHRDLKLDNILIMDVPIKYPYVVLADFGIAKQNLPLSYSQAREFSNSQLMYTVVGTAEYAAPEINLLGKRKEKVYLTEEEKTRGYDEKVDVWSLGIIVHILLSGVSPFYSESVDVILLKVNKGKLDFRSSQWVNVSSSAKNFISMCLTLDPMRRLNVEGCLKHEWLNK